MRKLIGSFAAVAALALFAAAGCKHEENESTTRPGSGSASMSGSPSYSSQPRSSGGMSGTMDSTSAGIRGTASGAADTTGRAAQGAGDTTGNAARDAATGAQNAADTAGARATEAAGTTSADSNAEAQKLLDQASQYIKDNKWDLADQTLTKLEGMKPQLPASYGPKIDGTRKLLNTAKSGGNLLGGGTGGVAK